MGDEEFLPTKNIAGPPVFYPQGDLFSKNKEDVMAREAELSAQGQYFSASYAAERGSKSKEESGEKGGAAVIPICLPLCCAAPCVIMYSIISDSIIISFLCNICAIFKCLKIFLFI